MEKKISAEFPFESKYIDVEGSKIHYIDEGTGDPILFLHGNPSSSYIWRNIIPYLIPYGRCIALDLIGMGKSDKPNLKYGFFDHVKYVEAFIEKMDLSNLTLVIHDWGSALGFHYAMRHESNVKGIAFMEAMVKQYKWGHFLTTQRIGLKMFRTLGIGWFLGNIMNVFITQGLSQMIVRKLSVRENEYYGAPYKTIKSRKPLLQWALEVPINGKPANVHYAILLYSQKLQESELSKILFFGNKGIAIDAKLLDWCKQNLKNLKVVDIGEGIHFLQEDNPHLIGEELAKWYQNPQ